MKLKIDTSNSEQIKISLDRDEIIADSREKRSQKLLSLLEEELSKKHIDINAISEVEINTGPGSFTGLRVGAAVANAIAWVKQIKINDKDSLVEPTY